MKTNSVIVTLEKDDVLRHFSYPGYEIIQLLPLGEQEQMHEWRMSREQLVMFMAEIPNNMARVDNRIYRCAPRNKILNRHESCPNCNPESPLQTCKVEEKLYTCEVCKREMMPGPTSHLKRRICQICENKEKINVDP